MKSQTIRNLIILGLVLMPALGMAAAISSVTADTTTVGRYDKYELTFNLTGVSPSNYNPFRPETTGDSLSNPGVDVWAEVTTPPGDVKKVWGFWDVDYTYMGNMSKSGQEGHDRMVPVSAPHWHIRYAPMEVGAYKIIVKAKDGSGMTTSNQLAFNCVESGSKGFIKTSGDGSRFVYSDGSPFVPFGTMCPYGTEKVAPTVASMKANGMNFIRKWLVNRDYDDIHRDLEGWSSYTSDTSTYRSGKRSATKSVTGSGTAADQSYIGCRPNTYYKAYAYIKTSSSFNGKVAVYVNEDGKNVTTISHTGTQIGSNANWSYSETVFKTGSAGEMLHFKPRVLSGSSGTVWIDDVGLYQCDSSGKVTIDLNMVFNPGFEQWTPTQLRLIPLARFEYLLQTCQDNGICVQPAIFDYRLWNKSNPTGLYAQFYGDWWTDPASIAQQDRVLRYLVARFASYRSLFAWELTNEMDASYTDVRGNWIAGRANFIKSGDPNGHMITNSYWGSPADYEYGQMDELSLNQCHYYINTEERTSGQGYPSWGTLSSGLSIDTSSSNAASGSKSLKATASGSTISDSTTIACKPSRSYTLRSEIKASGVSGQASVIVRLNGGSSPGSGFTLSSTGTAGYSAQSRTFTTGSTAQNFTVTLQLTGSSGTAWWDDIEVIDNVTSRPMLYNGGFESLPYGDDEFDWAITHTMQSANAYSSGPNGKDKAWASGEFGLMGANYNLSPWGIYGDTTKPRHDSTGIHVHNCVWAQLMASAALNTPTYWWVDEYIRAWNVYDAWKGAASFASALPFYDRRQGVCTEPDATEILASTTNSKIRLLGQKGTSSGYFWIENRESTWSRIVREGLTPSPTSATITTPGFDDGGYTASWYDTHTGKLNRTEALSVSGGSLKLSVTSLATDVAVIVQKVGGSQPPQVSLTLTVDKTSVAPADVVTYTLTYTNKGSGDAANVVISLPIPANTVYVSGSATGGGAYDSSANCVKWTLPTLSPGAAGQCTARVKVN